MNHVVCVKWGIKYPSKYANVLNSMVKRHTTVPYQFHCFTDDPNGLDTDINVIKLPSDPYIKSWWSKLWMFAPEMPIKGNILYFDLDVVIFDNIDPLFSHNGKFNIIRDFNRCRIKDWKLSNSSCMRWQAGTMHYLWDDFIINSANLTELNFKFFFSPAAYSGHIITNFDLEKHFENSFFKDITLEYLCGSKTLIIFLFELTLLTPSKIELISVG